jgi:hypothetical protein
MGWEKAVTFAGIKVNNEFRKKYAFGTKILRIDRQNSIINPYKVTIYDSGSGSGYTLKQFKTENSATKFAREYMRSN